jgi:L-threonylcarbamoyladenylate synthase
VSGGQDSVGLRCPSHPVAQALLAARSARAAAATAAWPHRPRTVSAMSPTTAQHVRDEFGDTVHVLDGGASKSGSNRRSSICRAAFRAVAARS